MYDLLNRHQHGQDSDYDAISAKDESNAMITIKWSTSISM
jgi:hypothetical protein